MQLYDPNNENELEVLLASVVEALKIQGNTRAIAILTTGSCSFEYDGEYGCWSLLIHLPISLFYLMTEEDLTVTKKAIDSIVSDFFIRGDHTYSSVVILPALLQSKDGWRDDALRYIKGEGITNQGRVRSDNIASKEFKGLLFRSKAEITLFEALTKARLAVAPLPVFVRIGKAYNRLEPDFIVIYKGLTFVVEVDGDSFHKELPSEADKRLIPLTFEGVEVRRIRAADIQSSLDADNVVRELISWMDSRKSSR